MTEENTEVYELILRGLKSKGWGHIEAEEKVERMLRDYQFVVEERLLEGIHRSVKYLG